MAVMIAGTQFWLWRAVDDEGEVLDLLVQRRRDTAAAEKLMRKLLKKALSRQRWRASIRWVRWRMTISFSRHQFPPAIIRHAVWLYLRFTLSYRDVEDLLAERGLDVSYETVRRWVLKFGPLFA